MNVWSAAIMRINRRDRSGSRRSRFGLVSLLTAFLIVPVIVCADPHAERKSGKVLILPNQRILEGDIERIGDRFRIRRPQGELWLPCEKAVQLCADWNDAYAYMAAHANLLDADERMRLAKWCQSNGLYDLALKEVSFVLELRPRDAYAQQFKMLVEQQARSSEKRAVAPVQTVSFEAPPSLDVGVKSLAMFSARVQPILMNTCARCHVSEKNIPFRLFRVTDTNFRTALQNNLMSALAQIDTQNPDLSPLLNKAVSLHGSASKSPLNGRDTVPFQTMQAWVRQVIDNNPHLRQMAARTPAEPHAAPALTPRNEGKVVSKANTGASSEEPKATPPATPGALPALPIAAAVEKTRVDSGFAQAAPQSVTPAVSAGPPDPYDPSYFNRLMHIQGSGARDSAAFNAGPQVGAPPP